MDRARDHYSIAEAGLGAKTKEAKEGVRGVYTLVQKEDKHLLYNEGCTIFLDNNASEAEEITETKKSRKVNHQIY